MDKLNAETIDKIISIAGTETILICDDKQAIAEIPTGRKLVSLKPYIDEYAARPDRRVGTDTLLDLASLAEWIVRHKDAGTLVFCDTTPASPSLLAIVDYHEEGPGDAKARFGKFRGLYQFPIDKRWAAWTEVDGEPMNQAEFAAFLEEHILDLLAPEVSIDGEGNELARAPDTVSRFLALAGGTVATPGEVVALSRGLDVTVEGKVTNRVNMQSGERNLVFEEVHGNGNGEKIRVPQLFLLGIPVFDRGSAIYRVPVRLRYRIDQGKVIWYPTLFGAEEIFDRAVRDAAAELQEKAAVPVLFGRPGA